MSLYRIDSISELEEKVLEKQYGTPNNKWVTIVTLNYLYNILN